MDAASTKKRPRRTMRVATIFTGVAALTTGVTQVANAQDMRTAVPAGAVSGNIKSVSNCGSKGIDATWLHVSTVSNYSVLGVPTTEYISDCLGNKGEFKSPRGTGIIAECGGNNYGFMSGLSANYIVGWGDTYGPGTTYRAIHGAHLSTVFISRWAGTDKCKKAPNQGKFVTGT